MAGLLAEEGGTDELHHVRSELAALGGETVHEMEETAAILFPSFRRKAT